MRFILLDNGNRLAEETAEYLKEKGHSVAVITHYPDESEIAVQQALIHQCEYETPDGLLTLVADALPTDGPIGQKHDTEQILKAVEHELYATERLWIAALPYLRLGTGKRIGLVTDVCSSVVFCEDTTDYARHMALAGLNMVGKLWYNTLRKEDFRFRWFAPCSEPGKDLVSPGEYFLMNFSWDPVEPFHSEENRFVLRDGCLREIPW